MRHNDDYRELVEELCQRDSGLNSWECDFVSDMLDWQGQYTEKQRETIERIYDKVM
jgi:hypothetical protein